MARALPFTVFRAVPDAVDYVVVATVLAPDMRTAAERSRALCAAPIVCHARTGREAVDFSTIPAPRRSRRHAA